MVSPAILARRAEAASAPQLGLPPLLSRPTGSSILINARNGPEDGSAVVELLAGGTQEVLRTTPSITVNAGGMLEVTLDRLSPATRYGYRIRVLAASGAEAVVAQGGFITTRGPDETFTAVLMTDPHTGTFAEGSAQVAVMDTVIRNVVRDKPDFVLALGDNVAWGSSRGEAQQAAAGAEAAYEMYRRHMGPITSNAPHFSVVGNWEGESGKFPPASLDIVRAVRHRLLPNPDHRTYPEGGGSGQDYFAFTWGSALFVMLNVQSYTKPSGTLPLPARGDVSLVDDWTLGPEQLAWLENTLRRSTQQFKFIGIHHAVGGNAGNPTDTLYGRGGARAVSVGEQRVVHQMMRDYGVQIFFYGHDHVFVDDIVDGIHYTLPGSFGAPWHFDPGVTGYSRYWADSGHARLTVSPKEAKVEFVNEAGSVIHEFRVAPRP